jgi:hypothetical protein
MSTGKRQRPTLNETLICRCPESVADAIERAAAAELISRAAYTRRAVQAALQRDGFLDQQRGRAKP